jgi:hypothetical protein
MAKVSFVGMDNYPAGIEVRVPPAVRKSFVDTSAMIHLVTAEKLHFSPCTNFTNCSGLYDVDTEKFTFFLRNSR